MNKATVFYKLITENQLIQKRKTESNFKDKNKIQILILPNIREIEKII